MFFLEGVGVDGLFEDKCFLNIFKGHDITLKDRQIRRNLRFYTSHLHHRRSQTLRILALIDLHLHLRTLIQLVLHNLIGLQCFQHALIVVDEVIPTLEDLVKVLRDLLVLIIDHALEFGD